MFYKIFIITFLLAILASVQGQQIQGLSGRIIGGEPTTIRDIPYQVSLWNGSLHFCGGALLSDEWVITAAHCMGKMPSYQIRINSTRSDSGGTLLNVTKEYTNPNFNEAYSYDYDVALVRVPKFNSTGLRFARWPKCNAEKCNHLNDTNIVVSGWGRNNITDPDKKFVLQKVRLPIVNLTECKKIYQYDSEISNHMFCAGLLKEGGKDSCQGDSGGPATCKNELVGVVSFGYECAKAGEPGIYTDLLGDDIQDWIEKITGMRRNCTRTKPLRVVPVKQEKKIKRVQQEMLERE